MHLIEKNEISNLAKLQDQLESQYGPAVAQDIVDRMRQKSCAATPDYMDVKAMSELQEKFRAKAMMAVRRLREWRKVQTRKNLKANLVELEDLFLQRQCVDSVKLYRQAHKTYHRLYREAMFSLTADDRLSSHAAGPKVQVRR